MIDRMMMMMMMMMKGRRREIAYIHTLAPKISI
jgi:hypothetical protein